MSDQCDVTESIRQNAAVLGFNLVGIAPAVYPTGYHPFLEWVSKGYDADMSWIRRRLDAYRHPDGVLPGTKSVIVTAASYSAAMPSTDNPRIARYATGTHDYHDVLRARLKTLASVIRDQCPKERSRVVVDTAPLLERDFARLAGVGWFGKNTMLISRKIGSWFFLGVILTTKELWFDSPVEKSHCGTCTRCLDACPTSAFPEPYVLDSNRCISYLTIERRSKSISDELKSGMQNWVFGCDICQEVCPWNRFAPDESMPEFQARGEIAKLSLSKLLTLNNEQFDTLFAGTPLQRTGRNVIVRNAAIAAGNSGSGNCLPLLRQLQSDTSELVREAADWAVRQLAGRDQQN